MQEEKITLSDRLRQRIIAAAAEHRENASRLLEASRRYAGARPEASGHLADLAREHFSMYQELLGRLGGRAPAAPEEDGSLAKFLDTEKVRRRRAEWAAAAGGQRGKA